MLQLLLLLLHVMLVLTLHVLLVLLLRLLRKGTGDAEVQGGRGTSAACWSCCCITSWEDCPSWA